jgi:NRAMP (natural resistance-associated macrophage protein)-like metal ion transporter
MQGTHSDMEKHAQPEQHPAGRVGRFFADLGPGLITGAADDDPSGISTYSVTGAAYGYMPLWTALFSFPLMAAVQLMCARLGLVTGRGLAGVLRRYYPRWVLWGACALLIVANVFNIGADLGGMAEATAMMTGINALYWIPLYTFLIISLLFWSSYRLIARIFKWLTLVLFAYIVAAFLAHPDWHAVLGATFVPRVEWSSGFLATFVGILGTTISPYLFFWQASQEVEEMRLRGVRASHDNPAKTQRAVRRMRLDTIVGMVFSNGIAFFVMLMGAVVLNTAGITDVRSASQAAQALRPLAGDFAFALFAAGIVATGLLAVPVLASSAAYAVAEALAWNEGLERNWREAKGFYSIIVIATIVGTGLCFSTIDPMKALVWSAVINGVVAVPIMVAMMVLSGKPQVMGPMTVRRKTRFLGWGAAVVMAAAVLMMGWDLVR